MKRLRDLSGLSKFFLFFLAPSLFAFGAYPAITFTDKEQPTFVGMIVIHLILYLFSLGIVGACFYFVQAVKWLTAYLIEKRRLARKRQA